MQDFVRDINCEQDFVIQRSPQDENKKNIPQVDEVTVKFTAVCVPTLYTHQKSETVPLKLKDLLANFLRIAPKPCEIICAYSAFVEWSPLFQINPEQEDVVFQVYEGFIQWVKAAFYNDAIAMKKIEEVGNKVEDGFDAYYSYYVDAGRRVNAPNFEETIWAPVAAKALQACYELVLSKNATLCATLVELYKVDRIFVDARCRVPFGIALLQGQELASQLFPINQRCNLFGQALTAALSNLSHI